MNIDNIAEERWKRDKAGQEVSGLLSSERTIVRKVDQINIKDLAELVEIVRKRTSVKNKDDGQKYYSVKDPMVDQVVQPGTWRGVLVRGIQDPAVGPAGVIQQVLAYGWATSISWLEARLGDSLEMQPVGVADYKFLTVVFPNIALNKMQSLASALADTASFTDPKIYGEPYEGTWYNSGVLTDSDKNGNGIITLKLSIQYRNIDFETSAISSDSKVETRQQLGLTTETQEPVANVDGQVKTQDVKLNKDSSKDVESKRDTGTAQEHETTIVSPAGTTTVSEKTVQTSELATPTSERGKIKRVINRISKYFSRYDTVEETNTPTDQTVSLVNKTYAGTTTTTKHTEKSVDLAEATLTRGTVKRQDARRTQAGNQETTEDSHVPTDILTKDGAADVFGKSARQKNSEVTFDFDDTTELENKVLKLVEEVRILKSVAVPAYIQLEDGEAGDMIMKDNESGNKEVTIKLESVNNTTLTEVDEKDAFSTKATTETTGATAKASTTSFEAGKIKTVINKWMRFKARYLTTTTTESSTPQSMLKPGALGKTTGTDAIIIDRSDTSNTQMERAYNYINAPTIASSETTVDNYDKSVRIESLGVNRFGKHDYVKYIKTHTIPASGGVQTWTLWGAYAWFPSLYEDFRLKSVKEYRRKYAHGLKFCLTSAIAKAYIDGADQASSFYRIGDHLYVAHSITASWFSTGNIQDF